MTDQFEAWWERLTEEERVSIDGMIRVLETHGASLGRPYSTEAAGSTYPRLRQLQVPHQHAMLCVLYMPDERRSSVVLLTGTALGTPDAPCPPEHIELADGIYRDYLAQRGDLR